MDILTMSDTGIFKMIELAITLALLLWLLGAKDVKTKIDILALFIMYIVGFYK